MIIGVVKEARAAETRVAATPATVSALTKLGYQVLVESGAGVASSFHDAAYVDAGAEIGDPLTADVVLGVNAPSSRPAGRACEPGATLVGVCSSGS